MDTPIGVTSIDERTRWLSGGWISRDLKIKIRTWGAYVARGEAPPPDGHDPFSGLPYWLPDTYEAYKRCRGSGQSWKSQNAA